MASYETNTLKPLLLMLFLLFLCVALGGLVQACLMYQWTPSGTLNGREKNQSSWLEEIDTLVMNTED